MLVLYIFKDPAVWIAPLVIQIISYVFILRKMGKRPLMGIIPVLGEYEMSQDLFRRVLFRSAFTPMRVLLWQKQETPSSGARQDGLRGI